MSLHPPAPPAPARPHVRRVLATALAGLLALAATGLALGNLGRVIAAVLGLLVVFLVTPAALATTWRRRALAATLGLVTLAATLALTLRLRFGGGSPYPDVTTAPLVSSDALERAVVSDEPIGNVAVTATGRIFFTIHPESRPAGARLLEWKDGKASPWPSAELQPRLGPVLGLAVDGRGWLWTIAHGNHGLSPPRLFAFELATGKLVHERAFTDAELGSFYQDLEVSRDGQLVYIADASFWRRNPAIVVYRVATGETLVRLRDHPSVYPQEWLIRTPAKQMTFFGGIVALQTGLDGIVLSSDDRWLAYAAMSHDGLYRVPTAALVDPARSDGDVAAAVERIGGGKPLSDGLGIDAAGNILVTDVEHGAVVRMSANAPTVTLIKSPNVRWADGVTFGPDGWLYLADSAIPDQMLQSKDHIQSRKPYIVWRFRPDLAGEAGR